MGPKIKGYAGFLAILLGVGACAHAEDSKAASQEIKATQHAELLRLEEEEMERALMEQEIALQKALEALEEAESAMADAEEEMRRAEQEMQLEQQEVLREQQELEQEQKEILRQKEQARAKNASQPPKK